MDTSNFEYTIDLDERGEFRAHVDWYGETVFTIDGFEIFEDGFMNNKNDVAGLREYLESLDLLKPRAHFHYGSGEHGCLYDNGPYYAETLQEAVDSLADTFELGRTRKAALKRDHYLELNPSRDGASYCEITSCSDDCKC